MSVQLFTWLNESSRVRLHTLLGHFLSQHLKKSYPNPTVEEFNEINREQLTRLFLEKNGQSSGFLVAKYNYTILSVYTETEFRRDISQFFDLKIPLFYFRLTVVKDNDWINYKKRYKGIRMFPGMKFQYKANIDREKEWIERCIKFKKKEEASVTEVNSETFELVPILRGSIKKHATEKQVAYIRNLSKRFGLKLVNERDIEFSMAEVIINSLIKGKFKSYAFFIRDGNGKVVTNGNFHRYERESSIYQKLEQVFGKMENNSSKLKKMNLSNIKNTFIRPWLEALDYDFTNHEEVYEDYKLRGGGDKETLDYTIWYKQAPLLVVKYTDNKKDFLELISTRRSFLKSARYFVITDTQEFSIYVNHQKFGLILLHSCKLSSDNIEMLSIFQALSKESLFNDEEPVLLKEILHEQLRETAVDQFKNMLKNPTAELLNLLKQEGFDEDVIASLFPKAVTEFIQDIEKESKPQKVS